MTTQTIKPAPVRKTLTIKASAARAFEVFTSGIGRWWPATHSIGAAPQQTAVLEPGVGGRWYEIGEDGSQCDWGRVLSWEPPSRLVLAWQIGPDFRFDPDLVTEVEVRFFDEGPMITRVEFEHRHLERMGERAAATRESLNGGWGGLLDLYVSVAETGDMEREAQS
jgi:uncharacterized protein YndB with AHSA1/START domain